MSCYQRSSAFICGPILLLTVHLLMLARLTDPRDARENYGERRQCASMLCDGALYRRLLNRQRNLAEMIRRQERCDPLDELRQKLVGNPKAAAERHRQVQHIDGGGRRIGT